MRPPDNVRCVNKCHFLCFCPLCISITNLLFANHVLYWLNHKDYSPLTPLPKTKGTLRQMPAPRPTPTMLSRQKDLCSLTLLCPKSHSICVTRLTTRVLTWNLKCHSRHLSTYFHPRHLSTYFQSTCTWVYLLKVRAVTAWKGMSRSYPSVWLPWDAHIGNL